MTRSQLKAAGWGLAAAGGLAAGIFVGSNNLRHIDAGTVVVSTPDMNRPVAVRHAWASNPSCNLYNGRGLPASPFRTDDWSAVSPKK